MSDTPLYRFLTFRMSRVQAKLNAQANAILQREAGLTLTQWRILALVGAARETTLSEMARTAALDKGLISRNLKAMVTDGLILASTDKQDHRIQHLTLSERGQLIYDRTLPRMQRRQDGLRSALTDAEFETMNRVLDKLEAAAEARDDG